MGGGDIEVPEPTAEEKALLAQQTAALNQQSELIAQSYAQQQMLQPVLLQASGIVPTYAADGKTITGYTLAPEEVDPNAAMLDQLTQEYLTGAIASQEQSNKLQQATYKSLMANAPLRESVEAATLERTLAALNGELPVDPTLVQELDRAEAEMEAQYLNQLGPGYATSSPYLEAKNKFTTMRESVLDSARRGEITSLGQLGFGMGESTAGIGFGAPNPGIGGYAQQQQDLQMLLGNVTGLSSQGYGAAGAYGDLSANYSNPLSWYGNNRAMQYDANKQEAANDASMWGSIFGGIGQIGGMALGGWMYGD